MPGLDRIPATDRRRTTVAATVAAVAMLIGCSPSAPARDEDTGELLEPTDIGVLDIRVGDCVDEFPDNVEVTTIRAVPCAESHTHEVMAEVRVPDTDEFPGADAVEQLADEECYAEFASFIGLPWEESELEFAYLLPTEESWDQDDRQIHCLVSDPAGPVTGSLADAER